MRVRACGQHRLTQTLRRMRCSSQGVGAPAHAPPVTSSGRHAHGGARRYQQTWFSASADDQGIQVTSHSMQTIRLPTLGAPRWPQFQHSLGSVFSWFPLICIRHPVVVLHDRDPQSRTKPRIYKAENV